MGRDGGRWSTIERDLRSTRGPLLAGVDEVGRGPLAGPVVACAVVMPSDARAIRGVDDSKALNEADRDKLAQRIHERAVSVSIAAASVREIDRYNIYHASVLAIRRAITRLAVSPDHVVIDGLKIRTLGIEHTAVVHGDARCHSIACASIIAKVTRDRLMKALARRHPHYRWETNVGYATADHQAGMASHGVTPHHRRSFGPVSQLSLELSVAAPADAPAIADALLDALQQEQVS
ncbi:MAG: ribonuclease HII [Gemmatimonadaceae bacterium]